MPTNDSDFLVIGSGLAGLLTALKLAKKGTVSLLTKRDAGESNTAYAQGGIAAVTAATDSFEAHTRDTQTAGAGLCEENIVRLVVEHGPAAVGELIALGVKFTQKNGAPDLGLEGGHSHRRILHAQDLTGKEIARALVAACKAEPNIKIYENYVAVDLILKEHARDLLPGRNECLGAYALNCATSEITTFAARYTLLATGGAGKVYKYTSNPDTASGDAMAMAYRAGIALKNMEFVQFHPTLLFHQKEKSFLISEALRGEGAILKLPNGEPFMSKYHKDRELAPRDVVARAIDTELKRTGANCVFLDLSHKDADFIRKRFPHIHATCLGIGIDITRQPIPVVPAAHFFCGGIETDANGKTALKNLYAAGECACTGLHGANRLASNSLLEACVFSDLAAAAILREMEEHPSRIISSAQAWKTGKATQSDEAVVIAQNWDEIRTLMWNYVGIVRTDKRLERAKRRMATMQEEIMQYYWDFLLTRDVVELRNIACVAEQIIRSAIWRRESRGLHYNADCPSPRPEWLTPSRVTRYMM